MAGENQLVVGLNAVGALVVLREVREGLFVILSGDRKVGDLSRSLCHSPWSVCFKRGFPRLFVNFDEAKGWIEKVLAEG